MPEYDGTKWRIMGAFSGWPQDPYCHEVPVYMAQEPGKWLLAFHGPQDPRDIKRAAGVRLPTRGPNPLTGAVRLPFGLADDGYEYAKGVPYVHHLHVEWLVPNESVGGDVTVSPTAATLTLTAVSPGVVLGSVAILPDAAMLTLGAVTPTVTLGATLVAPSAAALLLSAVNPTVLTAAVLTLPVTSTSTVNGSHASTSVSTRPASASVITDTPASVIVSTRPASTSTSRRPTSSSVLV
jgi:hypothetical protein